MRVTLVTNFLPPTQIGGTEVLSLNLATALQAKGYDVEVICADHWATARSHEIEEVREIYANIPVRRLNFNWQKAPDVFRSLYNNPFVEEYFRSYLRQVEPHIVHVLSCYSLSASPITAAADLKFPIVLTATDFWFLCARNTLLQSNGSLCSGPSKTWKCAECMLSDSGIFRLSKRLLPDALLERTFQAIGRSPFLARQRGLRGKHGDWGDRFAFLAKTLGKVDKIVTASKLVQEMFVSSGLPIEKVTYSAYGIDTSWAETSRKTEQTNGQLRIGYIGQIDPHKGLDLLIQAVNSLPPEAPVALIIYGNLERNPDYGRKIRLLAGENPRIIFAGTFPNAEMGRVMDGIDVLAVPSVWYDFPLVIYDALATKTPVLATDLPGMNEMIEHNVNGLLFPRYDWRLMAKQIERIAANPRLLTELARNIGAVKSIDSMADEYATLYESLLTKKSLSPRA